MQGGRRSSPRLYWRLKRPKPRVYAQAVGKLLLYRVAAAAAVAIAVILCALVGAVAANLNFPAGPRIRIQAHQPSLTAPHMRKVLSRWAASIHGQTIAVAISHAMAALALQVPAFLLIGLILVRFSVVTDGYFA